MNVATRCGVGYYGLMRFHEKVDALIRASGIPKAEIARRAELASSQLSRLGTDGYTGMRLHKALRLARVLNVTLDYLTDDSKDYPPRPEFSPEELDILGLAKEIGIEESRRRLLLKTAKKPEESANPSGAELGTLDAVSKLAAGAVGGADRVPDGNDHGTGAVAPKGGRPRRGT